MAEQLHNSDDAWAALQEELLSDSEFATTVHDMDDEMDMAIPSQNDPYYLEDITDAASTLYDAFILACQASGTDIYAEEQDEANYDNAGQELVYACLALNKQLRPDDILAAHKGIYATIHITDDTSQMFVLEPNDKLVGRFIGPVISRLPDESYFLAGDSERVLPAGAGLELGEAKVLRESGEVEECFRKGARIVVVLGITGMKLEKFHFASELDS